MTTRSYRRLRTSILLSLALILLGVGNIVYGDYKAREYAKLVNQAAQELNRPKTGKPDPLFSPTVNVDKQNQHIRKLDALLSYYQFVKIGGKGILALAGIVLLAGFTRTRLRTSPLKSGAAPEQT